MNFGQNDAPAFGGADAPAFPDFGANDQPAFGGQAMPRTVDEIARRQREEDRRRFETQSFTQRNLENPLRTGLANLEQTADAATLRSAAETARALDALDAYHEIRRAGATGAASEAAIAGMQDRVPLELRENEARWLEKFNDPDITRYAAAVADPATKQRIRGEIGQRSGAAARRILADEAAKQAIPQDPDWSAAVQSGSAAEVGKALLQNPMRLLRLTVENAPQAVAMIGPGLIAGPAGLGAASGAMEYNSQILDILRSEIGARGIPLTPESLQSAFSDPTIIDAAKTQAMKKGIPVGIFDAFSGALAGRSLTGALTAGATKPTRLAAESTAQVAGQAATGAAGEAVGQQIATGQVRGGDVLIEGVAEIGSAAPETATMAARQAIGAMFGQGDSPAFQQAQPQASQSAAPQPVAPAPGAQPAVPAGAVNVDEFFDLTGRGDPSALVAPQPAAPVSQAPAPDQPAAPQVAPASPSAADLAGLMADERPLAEIIAERQAQQAPAPVESPPPGAVEARREPDVTSPPVPADAPDVASGSPPKQGLVVAGIDQDGRIHYGKPGSIHANLWRAEKLVQSGFAGPDGKFLTREEALALLPTHDQQRIRDRKPLDNEPGLHAIDADLEMLGTGERTDPVQAATPEAVQAAAERVDQDATPAQREAGNYRKAHLKWQGLDIAIETPKGGTRTATDGSWEVKDFPAHYGYVKRSEGSDGDQIDVYLGDLPRARRVFVIDQIDTETGSFDEHKAMLGFDSREAAMAAYSQAFSDGSGPQRIGAVTAMSAPQFKAWVKNGETTKPMAYRRPAPAPRAAALETPQQTQVAQQPELGPPAGRPRPSRINTAATEPTPPPARPTNMPADARWNTGGGGYWSIPQVGGAWMVLSPEGDRISNRTKQPDLVASLWHKAQRAQRDMPGPKLQQQPSPDAALDFAAQTLLDLANEDGIFSIPVRTSSGLPTIIAQALPGSSYVGETTRPDERRDSGADHRYSFRTPRAADGGGGRDFHVYTTDDRAWIDVSALREGDRGQLVYAAIADWALNTDRVFVGDPAGMTEAAVIRRTSNMLASALRHGTTRHLAPGEAQERGNPALGIEPLAWKPEYAQSDFFDNLKALIHTFVATTYNRFPALDGYRYDFRSNRYVDRRGRPLDAARLDRGKGTPGARGARAGGKTLRRAVFLRSLLEAPDGQRSQILERVLNGGRQVAEGAGPLFARDAARNEPTAASPTARPAGFGRRVTPAFGRQSAAILAELRELARQMFGRRIAVVSLDEARREIPVVAGQTAGATAAYFHDASDPYASFIALALAGRDQADIVASLRHEGIHHLRAIGAISPREWRVLSDVARKQWREMFDIEARYAGDQERLGLTDAEFQEHLDEEAVAEAFGAYQDGQRFGAGIEALFDKIAAFLLRVKNLLAGHGFRTWEDVFQAIERGEKADGGRQASDGQAAGVPAYAQRQAGAKLQAGPAERTGNLRVGAPNPADVEFLANQARGLIGQAFGQNRPAIRRVLDNWQTVIQDRFLPLKRLQERIAALRGSPIADAENAYLSEEGYTSRAGERLLQLRKRFTEPLFDAIAKARVSHGVTQADVEAFLYARHAPERNAAIAKLHGGGPDAPEAGSGMTNDEARETLNRLKAEGKISALAEIAKIHDAMHAHALATRVELGLMSQADADAWRRAYRYYTPLRGKGEIADAIDPEDETRPNIGSGYGGIRGAESKRALGRSTKAPDLLANSLMLAQEAIIRGEKNQVGLALLKLARDNPDPTFWRVDAVKTRRYVDKDSGAIRVQRDTLPRDDQFYVKENGVEHWITIDHPRLVKNLKNLGADQLGVVFRALAPVMNFLKLVRTGWNPEFIITNALRDLQTGAIHLSNMKVRGLVLATLRDYPKALKAGWGGTEGRADTEWQRYYREFAAAGGKTDSFKIDDLEAARDRLAKELSIRSPGRGPMLKRSIRLTLETVDRANQSVENAIRLSAYVNARRSGFTPMQAASLAKNLTVNFNRRGEWGREMSTLYMFFNASVQGTAAITTNLASRDRAKRAAARRNVLGIVALGFAAEMMNAFLSPEDDDGEKFYDKLTPYEKSRNLIVMNPLSADGNPVKIPLALGYNAFYDFGRNLAAFARGRQGLAETAGNIMTSTLDAFNPVGGAGNPLVIATPTILQPGTEILINRDYKDAPIYPEHRGYDTPPPDSQMYFRSVSPVARWLAEQMNAASGGNEFTPGDVDVSPESLEHVYYFAVGGIGRLAEALVDLPAKVREGDFGSSEVPFLRRLYGAHYEGGDKNRFYDRHDQIVSLSDRLKKLNKDGRKDEADALANENRALLSLRRDAEQTRRSLTTLNKQLAASTDPAERRGIEVKIKAAVDRFNALWREKIGSIE